MPSSSGTGSDDRSSAPRLGSGGRGRLGTAWFSEDPFTPQMKGCFDDAVVCSPLILGPGWLLSTSRLCPHQLHNHEPQWLDLWSVHSQPYLAGFLYGGGGGITTHGQCVWQSVWHKGRCSRCQLHRLLPHPAARLPPGIPTRSLPGWFLSKGGGAALLQGLPLKRTGTPTFPSGLPHQLQLRD